MTTSFRVESRAKEFGSSEAYTFTHVRLYGKRPVVRVPIELERRGERGATFTALARLFEPR